MELMILKICIHLSDKFSEVYFYGNFNNYELLSFLVKLNDLKYIIHSIRGSIIYKNDINKCKIVKEITNEPPVFINAEKDEGFIKLNLIMLVELLLHM